jgi:hypothetical protein
LCLMMAARKGPMSGLCRGLWSDDSGIVKVETEEYLGARRYAISASLQRAEGIATLLPVQTKQKGIPSISEGMPFLLRTYG